MKNNSIVKRAIEVMVITSILMLALSFRAVYAVIDINSGDILKSIDNGSTSGNTDQDPTPAEGTPKNNTVEENNTTQNNTTQNNTTTEKNNTTNRSSSAANQSELPATGSNTEIIFVVGAAVLAGVVVVIYKKANIKID